jgi:hypothetical protein
MLGPLPRPENDLGEPLAQRAMVIHPRETEIFERKMLEAPGAFMRRDGAAPDFFQEFQQVLAIHTVEMPLNIGESIPQPAFTL